MPTHLVRPGGKSADCADSWGLQCGFRFDELERVEALADLHAGHLGTEALDVPNEVT